MPKTLEQVLAEEQQRADAESSDPMLHMLASLESESQAQASAAPVAAPSAPAPGDETSQPDPNAPGFLTHLGRSIAHAPAVGSDFLVRGLEGAVDTAGLLPADARRELRADHEHLARQTAADQTPELTPAEAEHAGLWDRGVNKVERGVESLPGMGAEMASLAIPGAGLPVFATAAGGNTTEDALDAGVDPGTARFAGAVSGVANLVAPGLVGKAITPVAETVGRTVGAGLGKTAGGVTEAGVHGAATGEGLNLAQAGATAIYDPEQALDQVEDPTMAVIGGLGGAAGGLPRARADARRAQQQDRAQSVELWDRAHAEAPTIEAPPEPPPPTFQLPQDFDPAAPGQTKLLELQRMEAEQRRAAAARADATPAPESGLVEPPEVPTGSPLEDPERAKINADVDRTRWGQANAEMAEAQRAADRSREIKATVDQDLQDQLRHREGELQAAKLTETAQQRGMRGSFRYDPATGQHEYAPAAEAAPAAAVTPEHIAALSRSIDDLRAAITRPTPAPIPEEVPHEVHAPQERPPVHPEGEVQVPAEGRVGRGRVARSAAPDRAEAGQGEPRAVGDAAEGQGKEGAAAGREGGPVREGHEAEAVAGAGEGRQPPGEARVLSSPVGEPEPPAPGHVRFYHGGIPSVDSMPRDFINDRRYAEGYARKSGDEGKLQYVDIHVDDPRIDNSIPEQGPRHGNSQVLRLTRDETPQWKQAPVRSRDAPAEDRKPRKEESPSNAAPKAKPSADAPPRATRESIRQSIERTPIARKRAGYADTIMELIDGRAAALGMHPDEYVGRRLAGVQNEPYKAKAPSLNEAETFDQRLEVPSAHLRHEYLLKQWKKAHGDRSPTPGDRDWQKLVKQAAMVDEAQGRTFTDDTLAQEKPLNEAGVAGHSPEVVKRGAISFLHDGRAIIQALEHSDESTIPHELLHMFRRELTDEDRSIAERWAGVKDGKWTRPQEERFARAGERWMRNGNAPIPELKSVFQKLHDWLKAIYTTIRNSPLDVKLTPEMEALFGRLFKPGQKLPEGMGDEAMRAPETAKETGETAKQPAAGERTRPSMNQKDAFGRPDLAKQGATDAGRSLEDQVDEARKLKPKGPTPDEVKQKASTADADDTQKVILERAAAGETYRNDEERAAAKIAVRKAVDAAGTDPEKIKAAARLVNAHRDVMAVWSKIGRQSWDELETPDQRYAHAREDVYDPPRGLQERMRAARKMADELFQKEGQSAKVKKLRAKIDALEAENAKRVARVKRRVKGYGFDLDDPAAPWVHDPDQLQEVKRAIVAANGDGWDAAHEVYLNARHYSLNLINPLGGVKTSADAASIITHFAFERPLEALANSIKGSVDSATAREFPEILKGLGRAFTGDPESGVPSIWRSFTRSLVGDTHAFDADFEHAMAGENELHHFGAKNYGQIPGKAGTVLRFSIRMVKALDSAMKTLAAHMDVGAQAVRLARRDGIAPDDLADFIHRQVTDTEGEAWHNAVATARGLTFTAKPGYVVRKINEFKYMNPKNGAERAMKEAFRYQFLFPGIPTQIIKRGFAMLPGVGPLMMMAKTGKALFDMRPAGDGWSYSRGEFNRDLATSALAGGLATLLGTAVAGAKTKDGSDAVTGFNDEERPTTVNLFGKDWNYKKALGPLAHPIATAMDFFHATHHEREVDAHGKPISHWGTKERHGDEDAKPADMRDRVNALVASLGEQGINESMWRSTVDLGKALKQLSGEVVKGDGVKGDLAAKFIGNFVTGFIPTVLKQAGGSANPVVENRKLEGDFWHRLGQSTLYNLDTPGLGQAPPKVGYFGQPITKETLGGPATTWLWRMTGGEKLGNEPDTSLGGRVVARWNEQHEDHPFPALAAKIDGATNEQRDRIFALAGQATEDRLTTIKGLNPNDPSFRSMRVILMMHKQEVEKAKRKVLGR